MNNLSFEEGNENQTKNKKFNRNEENENFSFEENVNQNTSFDDPNMKEKNTNMSFSAEPHDVRNVSFQGNPENTQGGNLTNLSFQANPGDNRNNMSFEAGNCGNNNISFENREERRVSFSTNSNNNFNFEGEKLPTVAQESENFYQTPQKNKQNFILFDENMKNMTLGNSKFVCKAEPIFQNENQKQENFFLYANINNISFEEPEDKSRTMNMSFEDCSKKNSNDRSKILKEFVSRTSISTNLENNESTISGHSNCIKRNLVNTLLKLNLTSLVKIVDKKISLSVFNGFNKIRLSAREKETSFFKILYVNEKIKNSLNNLVKSVEIFLKSVKNESFKKLKEKSKIDELNLNLKEKEKEKKINELSIINSKQESLLKYINDKIRDFESNQTNFLKLKEKLDSNYLETECTVTDYPDQNKSNKETINLLQNIKEILTSSSNTQLSLNLPPIFNKNSSQSPQFRNLANNIIGSRLTMADMDLSPTCRSKAVTSQTPHYSNYSFSFNLKRFGYNPVNMFFIKSKNNL